MSLQEKEKEGLIRGNITMIFLLVVIFLTFIIGMYVLQSQEICEFEIEGKMKGAFERINLDFPDNESFGFTMEEIDGKLKVKMPCYLLKDKLK